MTATAFVLAAGLGTRLDPLTRHRPKPLVPVCGVPMLGYALALCAGHGQRDVVVNAHHLAPQLKAWEGRHMACAVTVVEERPHILGTGGALKAAAHLLAETFVVVNADVLSDVDLNALLDAVPDGGGAMALRPHEADRYGVVAADDTGTVVKLVDVASATPTGVVHTDTHFTGIHALHRGALDLVPPGPQCIVRTAYRALVPQRKVKSVRHTGTWLDVGDPAAYLAANLAVLTTTLSIPYDPLAHAQWARSPRDNRGHPPGDVSVDGCAFVGRGALLGTGVFLRDTIVGDRAVVPDHTRLTRCVVWDGVHVPAGDWTDTIFHDGGVLRPGVTT